MKHLFLTLAISLFSIVSFAQADFQLDQQPGEFLLRVVVSTFDGSPSLPSTGQGIITLTPDGSGNPFSQVINLQDWEYTISSGPSERIYQKKFTFDFNGTIQVGCQYTNGWWGIGQVQGYFNQVGTVINLTAAPQ
ncbi:MAG: hypothetical protein JEZ03_18580 [Bacteroidales bacterium]|nr:hypothetical protein [Bacteroidales bacterium]